MSAGRGILAAALAATSVAALVPAASAHQDTELVARLRGSDHYPSARGFSEYEGGEGERSIEVTVRARAAAGRKVVLLVDGRRVGRMHLNGSGFAHREWETEHGQAVPVVNAGDPVRVRVAATRTLLVRGRYRLHH